MNMTAQNVISLTGRQGQPLPEHASGVEACLDLFGLAISYPGALSVAVSVDLDDVYCPATQGLYRALKAAYSDGGEVTLDTVMARLFPGELRAIDEALGGVDVLQDIAIKASFPKRAAGLKENIERAAGHRRTLGRISQIEQAVLANGDYDNEVRKLADDAQDKRANPIALLARTWKYTPPDQLPPRRWLYDRHLIRGFVSCTVSPGGLGKSALELVKALSLATGRALLGPRPDERVKVWFVNCEDPLDEIQRRIAAACLHYDIRSRELEGWLVVGSGRDADMIAATMTRDGVAINEGLARGVIATIKREGIGAVFIDPFVSTHRLPENDNGAIDAVVKRFWGRIAEETGCAISIVHHTKKGTPGQATTVEDSRGAIALIGAARSALVLNPMTEDEAAQAGIDNRAPYFRANNGKANLAPANHGSDWYRFVSVDLGNGDNVGVVTFWQWPAEMKVDLAEVAKVHAAMDALPAEGGRVEAQSPHWLGYTVAQALGLDVVTHKRRIKNRIAAWQKAGHLATEARKDGSRKERAHYIASAPPENV